MDWRHQENDILLQSAPESNVSIHEIARVPARMPLAPRCFGQANRAKHLLSMRHDRADPGKDIPARFPITTQCYSAKAKVQFTSSTVVATPEEKGNNAAQFGHGFVQASRELSRVSISPISIPALAMVAFTVLFAVRRHRTDSVKRQSKSQPRCNNVRDLSSRLQSSPRRALPTMLIRLGQTKRNLAVAGTTT